MKYVFGYFTSEMNVILAQSLSVAMVTTVECPVILFNEFIMSCVYFMPLYSVLLDLVAMLPNFDFKKYPKIR